MKEKELKACVSGSFFKFKPEIDLAISELSDYGFTILSPEKGWLYKPAQQIFNREENLFRPLPSEVSISIKNIEDTFLSNMRKSDFLYVIDPGGYVGNSVCMEIGFALALDIPVFLEKEISPLIMEENPVWKEIKPKLRVAKINEVAKLLRTDRLSVD